MLCEATDSADGIRFDDAIAQLCAADFNTDDAEYAVERLLNRGYLYQVDGELFVTEREDTYGNSENEK
jgi:hypothetical protein